MSPVSRRTTPTASTLMTPFKSIEIATRRRFSAFCSSPNTTSLTASKAFANATTRTRERRSPR